jgi:hypothetical protein
VELACAISGITCVTAVACSTVVACATIVACSMVVTYVVACGCKLVHFGIVCATVSDCVTFIEPRRISEELVCAIRIQLLVRI